MDNFILLSKPKGKLFKAIGLFIALILFIGPITYASPVVYDLPSPNQILPLSKGYSYPLLKGIRFNPDNPLSLEFIIDTVDKKDVDRREAERLIKYFMAGLTLPEDELWVNLSPLESERIASDNLALTDLGKDMLSQDYILKQLTASLTYPESDTGKYYWQKVYQKAYQLYGTTKLPIDTFNKVWLMPNKCVVYEQGNTALISEASIKAMAEEDYLALQKLENRSPMTESRGQNTESKNLASDLCRLTSETMKQTILPVIEKEVNQGESFSHLRQIYYSLVLSVWFKQKFKQSFYKNYIEQSKIKGIDLSDPKVKDNIYNLYVEAYQKGVFNYIRKDYDVESRKNTARRYYSGGIQTPTAGTVEIIQTEDLAAKIRELTAVGKFKEVEILCSVYSDASHDENDKKIEEAFAQKITLRVADSIVEDVINIFNKLGNAGRLIAGKIIKLHEKNGINIVEKINHSHAGGKGIYIQIANRHNWARNYDYIKDQLIHEAISGTIFGHSGEVHNLAVRIVETIRNNQLKEAGNLLNNLPENISFAEDQKALWEMNEGEKIKYQRDYANVPDIDDEKFIKEILSSNNTLSPAQGSRILNFINNRISFTATKLHNKQTIANFYKTDAEEIKAYLTDILSKYSLFVVINFLNILDTYLDDKLPDAELFANFDNGLLDKLGYYSGRTHLWTKQAIESFADYLTRTISVVKRNTGMEPTVLEVASGYADLSFGLKKLLPDAEIKATDGFYAEGKDGKLLVDKKTIQERGIQQLKVEDIYGGYFRKQLGIAKNKPVIIIASHLTPEGAQGELLLNQREIDRMLIIDSYDVQTSRKLTGDNSIAPNKTVWGVYSEKLNYDIWLNSLKNKNILQLTLFSRKSDAPRNELGALKIQNLDRKPQAYPSDIFISTMPNQTIQQNNITLEKLITDQEKPIQYKFPLRKPKQQLPTWDQFEAAKNVSVDEFLDKLTDFIGSKLRDIEFFDMMYKKITFTLEQENEFLEILHRNATTRTHPDTIIKAKAIEGYFKNKISEKGTNRNNTQPLGGLNLTANSFNLHVQGKSTDFTLKNPADNSFSQNYSGLGITVISLSDISREQLTENFFTPKQ